HGRVQSTVSYHDAGSVNVASALAALDASLVWLAGMPLTTGPVVSRTWTVNWSLSESPSLSVTVHVTVVVPTGKVEPEAGVQPALAMSPGPSGSLNVTVNGTAAPPGPVASIGPRSGKGFPSTCGA